jgi:hypothetical protein
MALARLYIDGEPWEVMGNVVDSFLPYTNSVEASRGGRIYASTESRVRTVSVDDVKLDINEFEAIANFFSGCGNKRFNVTVALNEDCPADLENGYTEYHYVDCLLQGEPEFSIFEKKVSNFEFGYGQRIIRNGI